MQPKILLWRDMQSTRSVNASVALGPSIRPGSHLGRGIVVGLSVALALLLALAAARIGYETTAVVSVGILLLVALFLHMHSRPLRALTVLTLSMPLVAVGVIEAGWSIRPTQIITLLIWSGWLFGSRHHFVQLPLSRVTGAYLAWLFFAALWAVINMPSGAALSSAMSARASMLRPFVQFVVIILEGSVFPAVLLLVHDQRAIGRAMRLLIGVTVVLCLYGIYQTCAAALGWPLADVTQAFALTDSATTHYGETRFYSGITAAFAPRATFAESLHFAGYLVGLWPILLAGVLARRRLPASWQHWPWTTAAVLTAVTLVLTFSRSGWLAGLVGSVWVIAWLWNRRTVTIAVSGVFIIGAALTVLTNLPVFSEGLSVWELVTGRMSLEWMAVDPRVEYAQVLLQTFIHHPVFGIGLGNFGSVGAEQLGLDQLLSAHGVWSAHLVEGGIVGLGVLVLLIGSAGKRIARGMNTERGGTWFVPLVGFSGGLLAMGFQYLTYGDRFSVHFWYMLGMAVVIAGLAIKNHREANASCQ